jgi:hypothetical protein
VRLALLSRLPRPSLVANYDGVTGGFMKAGAVIVLLSVLVVRYEVIGQQIHERQAHPPVPRLMRNTGGTPQQDQTRRPRGI